MKKISQIAKECGIKREKLVYFIKVNEIIPAKIGVKKIKFFDKYQENFMHECLFVKEVTYESKMNIPEPIPEQESFEDFKKRTYGRR